MLGYWLLIQLISGFGTLADAELAQDQAVEAAPISGGWAFLQGAARELKDRLPPE